MNKNNVYSVILAGGNGERLWPLSRQNKPKQLIPLADQETLLEQAITRTKTIVNPENTWVITLQQYAPAIREILGTKIGTIIVEPIARNTAAAILLSCFEIIKKDPLAIVLFLPADHIITPEKTFKEFLNHAIDYAQQTDTITLFGLKPSYPATGYGYIEYDAHEDQAPFSIKKFHEKPVLEVAQEYLKNPAILWNIGIFCAKASTFITQFTLHAPEIFNAVYDYTHGNKPYSAVQATSIDYAVLQKSNNLAVLPVNFSWYDVGNLTTFLSLQKNQHADNVVSVHAQNNLVSAKKLVALIGVENLCVIETDDVLLIARQDQTEKVRAAVLELKKKAALEYL